ncbi:hypothetical protein DQ384_36720 [Sphaerisporangium album]|uniref:Uncharacterized protein n=1 Tax=Sphaerisporangium album TaxID=509200 RepID=A0A367EUS9_9ACTN|nr:hypothetical protein [Sphaerisporangium album]RCG21157.1 hypothetical protein DQ384_36720 [Sphaerisporangium album]
MGIAMIRNGLPNMDLARRIRAAARDRANRTVEPPRPASAGGDEISCRAVEAAVVQRPPPDFTPESGRDTMVRPPDGEPP